MTTAPVRGSAPELGERPVPSAATSVDGPGPPVVGVVAGGGPTSVRSTSTSMRCWRVATVDWGPVVFGQCRDPHHQRGQGRESGRVRCDQQAAGDDRVGIIRSYSPLSGFVQNYALTR